ATLTPPVSVVFSASQSVPVAQTAGAGQSGWAVTPSRRLTDEFCAVKGPEPTLYRSVSRSVVIVSQPSVTLSVYEGGVKVSRPMALNVAASVNLPSPAYS